MKVYHLRKLFKYLPEEFVADMGDKEFVTCWYASSAPDKRPMELLDYSHPDSLTKEKVDVFFYNDIEFYCNSNENSFFYYNGGLVDFINGKWLSTNILVGHPNDYYLSFQPSLMPLIRESYIKNSYWMERIFGDYYKNEMFSSDQKLKFWKNNWANAHSIINSLDDEAKERYLKSSFDKQSSFITHYGKISFDFFIETYEPVVMLVKHQRFDRSFFYTFYCQIDDATFEKILINRKIKIDFAAHRGGYSGPGPKLLGNLGCRFALGYFFELPNQEGSQPEFMGYKPYTIKKLREFNWITENDTHCFWKILT
jgi:hypothetical protein